MTNRGRKPTARKALLLVVAVGLGVQIRQLNDRLDTAEARVNAAQEGADAAQEVARQVTAILTAPDVEVHHPTAGAASVAVSHSHGQAVFLASGMSAAPADRAYQLWTIDGGGPRPAGLLELHNGRATQLMTGPMRDVAAVAVTVEPSTGSPQPTTPPVMEIPLNA